MVKRPYSIANSRQTKRIPITEDILNDHNPKKVKEFKSRNKRKSRRLNRKSLDTLTEAINDGRFKTYDRSKDDYKPIRVKPVRRFYNRPDSHLFSIGDSWPDR